MTNSNYSDLFADCQSPETIKSKYRLLAKQYHPDAGGSEEAFKQLNAAYLSALKNVDGYRSTDKAGKEHRYSYNGEHETAIINKLRDLQSLRMSEDVTIALIGTWLWVKGNTRPFKDQLKELGCKYSGEKTCWYWHPGSYRRRGAKGGDFGSMAWKYGYKEFANSDDRPTSH